MSLSATLKDASFLVRQIETVNRRIKAALAQGLKVIFCIGETLKEREEGKTFSVIERQIEGGIEGIGG